MLLKHFPESVYLQNSVAHASYQA
jgi:anaphase-promoting complex subunit 8